MNRDSKKALDLGYLGVVAFVLGCQIMLGWSDMLLLAFAIIAPFYRSKAVASNVICFRVDATDWMVAIGFCWVFFVKLFSAAWSIDPSESVDNAFNHLQFMLWPGVMLFFSRSKVEVHRVEPWIAVSLFLLGLWYLIVRQFWPHSENAERFGGGVGSYGMLATSITVFLLWLVAALTRPVTDRAVQTKFLMVAGFVFGLVALIGTQARTELGCVAIGVVGVLFFRVRNRLRWRGRLAMVAIAAILLMLSVKAAEDRFGMINGEVSSYLAGGEQREASIKSSIGGRMEMYRMAIEAIVDRPLLGWGAGVRPSSVSQYATDSDHPLQFRNFHSLFLQSLAETGVFGSLVSFFIIAAVFWVTVVKVWRNGFLEIGLLVGIVWFVYFWKSLLNATFGYNLTNGIFVLLTALFWVWYRQSMLVEKVGN